MRTWNTDVVNVALYAVYFSSAFSSLTSLCSVRRKTVMHVHPRVILPQQPLLERQRCQWVDLDACGHSHALSRALLRTALLFDDT